MPWTALDRKRRRIERLERALAQAGAGRAVAAAVADVPEVLAAREDVNAFAEFVSGEPQAAYHRELQAACDQNRFLLVEAPPKTGKTQQLLRRIAWLIGRNPSIRIGIVCANALTAAKWVGTIGDLITSERYRRVFPHVRPAMPWTRTQITVQRPKSVTVPDPTVIGIGLDGSFLGARLDLLFCDDILTLSNTATRYQREALREWFESSMCLGRLLDQGRAIVTGNTWRKDDLIHELAAKVGEDGQPVYHYMRTPICDPEISYSAIPELWTIERLKEQLDLYGASKFAWLFRCIPRGDETSLFKEAMFDFPSTYPWTPVRTDGSVAYACKPGETIAVGVDLAVGLTDKHDETAFVVVLHRAADKTNHVLSVDAGHWTGPQIVDRLLHYQRSFPGLVARVEENGGQTFLITFADQKLTMPIVPHRTTAGTGKLGDKIWGAENLAAALETGKLRIARTSGGELAHQAVELRAEALHYSIHDHMGDRLMALNLAYVQATGFLGSIKTY